MTEQQDNAMRSDKNEAISGCLLGTAVGDALGLPYEGISPRRARRLLGSPTRYRFFWGHGMVSDDTEHTCMVAQSLLEAGNDVEKFTRRFAARLRWWLLALPAGVGKATARAILKLWFGFTPAHAGVFSAGNGPAMRAAIFGATLDETAMLLRFVKAAAHLTHTDPKATWGAIAVALAAREARVHATVDPAAFLALLTATLGPEAAELLALSEQARASVLAGETTMVFAATLGLAKGVTGYTYHTVPVVLHAWFSHPRDYAKAVTSVIECGGDTDTTAAIVGGIVGAGVGRAGIPPEWIAGLWEWPRGVTWMETLGMRLAAARDEATVCQALSINPFAVALRNLLFCAIVLVHVLRRLAPPY